MKKREEDKLGMWFPKSRYILKELKDFYVLKEK
jgi:hypothetical protein